MKNIEQTVNLGEIKLGKKEGVLTSYGLGSCVGVALYDTKLQIGGMAHVVLPSDIKYQAEINQPDAYLLSLVMSPNPAKYADSGLRVLLYNLQKKGAKLHNLRAKIAGGASVLAPKLATSVELDIGKRNIEAVEKVLLSLDIPTVGGDVGGNKGRTMRFYLNDGTVEISTFGLAKTVL